MKTISDLEYVKRGEKSLKLDLHLPDTGGRPFPVVVCIPGGGWKIAMKNTVPLFLADHGIAVAAVEYRIVSEAPAPANIQDLKAAVDWIVRHAATYHLDPHRIGAYGASAGGHLAALLGMTTGVKELSDPQGAHQHPIRAVCDVCAPADLLRMAVPENQQSNPGLHEALVAYLGGPVESNKELTRLVSPLTYVSINCPPMLLIHGEKDDILPVEESRLFHKALEHAGADTTLIVLKDSGHDWLAEETRDDVIAFFQKHLKK
jgi:acetyl esterase/lipase